MTLYPESLSCTCDPVDLYRTSSPTSGSRAEWLVAKIKPTTFSPTSLCVSSSWWVSLCAVHQLSNVRQSLLLLHISLWVRKRYSTHRVIVYMFCFLAVCRPQGRSSMWGPPSYCAAMAGSISQPTSLRTLHILQLYWSFCWGPVSRCPQAVCGRLCRWGCQEVR